LNAIFSLGHHDAGELSLPCADNFGCRGLQLQLQTTHNM